MKIIKKYMKRNDCYIEQKKIVPKGIMVHSTNSPGHMADIWYEWWNKSYEKGEMNRQVCVAAFLDDKVVYQYLPWDHLAWHCGGKGNNTHIGFEICEPEDVTDKEYFKKAWENAIELAVFLCKKYNLNHTDIIDHCEGHELGIASNHPDTRHWFFKMDKSMDDFREDVRKRLKSVK